MARRLTTIARFINMHMPGYRADVAEDYVSTDRKIPGTRLRHPGKGRYGSRLLVYKNGKEVLDHRAVETYRCNEDVEIWLRCELEKIGLG